MLIPAIRLADQYVNSIYFTSTFKQANLPLENSVNFDNRTEAMKGISAPLQWSSGNYCP